MDLSSLCVLKQTLQICEFFFSSLILQEPSRKQECVFSSGRNLAPVGGVGEGGSHLLQWVEGAKLQPAIELKSRFSVVALIV